MPPAFSRLSVLRPLIRLATVLATCCVALACRADSLAWFEAARMGEWPVLESQLAAGADINRADYIGMTALHHAFALGQTDTVRRLLERNPDIAQRSKEHSTWDWAVFGGDLDAFRLLLDHRGAYGRLNRTDLVALFQQAIAFGRDAFVDELEKHGARLAKGSELDEALITAVRCEQPRLAERLLRQGANPNHAAEDNREHPLGRAAFLGRVDLIDLLLRHGARIDAAGGDMNGNFSAVTALDLSVMADQHAATRKLLEAGANPRVHDNRPLLLADLIGDAKLREALLRAGARPASPFTFARWLPNSSPASAKPAATADAAYWGRQLAAMGVFNSADTSPDALAGRKLAILALDESMKDAEALLTARLSADTGATLLERDEMRRIARERNLQGMLSTPGREAAAGRLLGADVLVLLRRHAFDQASLREAKVVAVATGLVVGTALAEGKTPLDPWTHETVSICRTAGPLVSGQPENIRLVSVPRVIASLNTALARELERRLTVTLAARLGRLPGVIVVERADLDRLALEKDASAPDYSAGAWLMDAVLDLPASASERAVDLRITLKQRSSATDRVLRIDGSLDDVNALVEKSIAEVQRTVATVSAEPWKPSEEAAAFLKKADQFKQAFLWPDVAAAVEAARALGLENDTVTRLRMEAAVQRILHSSQRLVSNKRARRAHHGIAELVSYRAALLMPAEDSRELDLAGYLDHANLALDIFAASLARPGAKVSGVSFDRWVCGEFWDAATVPLRLTEPLSYQDEYNDELSALRARLLELNDQAVALARERGEILAVQTLLGIRLKHLAFWLPDENAFQTEARALLARARDWRPPLSAQSLWTGAFEVARINTRMINGRAGQAWIRLAETLSRSDLPDERYLGVCLLGMETFSPAVYWDSVRSLREQFTELNRLDRGIVTEIYNIGMTVSDRPYGKTGCRNWHETAFLGLLRHGNWSLSYNGLWNESAWSITGQNGRHSPELRAFMFEQALLRAQTLRAGHPGGSVNIDISGRAGFTSAQVTQLGAEFAAALPVIEALAPMGESTKYAITVARLHAKLKGKDAVSAPAKEVRLSTGPVRNPFVTAIPVTPAQRDGMSILLLDRNMHAARTGWNLLRRDTYEQASGHRTTAHYFYRIDASGNPTDFQLFPNQTPKAGTNGDHLSVNERWLVIAGYQADPAAQSSHDVWLIADMSQKLWRWRVMKSAGTRTYSAGTLVGDHFVYPFIHNPTGPGSGGADEYETKGDPTFGVIDIDLLTGRETLVASSRRQPAVTPAESERIAPFKAIRAVSPTGIVIQGKHKTSAHVYNTVAGTWSPYDDAFKAAQKKNAGPRFARPGYVLVDDTEWNISSGIRDGRLRAFIPGGNRVLDIPVDIPENEDLASYADYRRAVEAFEQGKTAKLRSISWQSNGGVISAGAGFYYWLPMDQIRAAIRAHAATK